VEEGHIVEGHGDLRPEHVYLGERLEILDCLEFNRAFRILDTADELAYLAMECTFEGDPRVAAWLFDEYADVSGDTPPEDLTAFYKCHRAMLRAKLAIWHLDNLPPPDREKWTGRARQYLELARAYGAVMNAKPLL